MTKLELVCPGGSPAALQAAVDAGVTALKIEGRQRGRAYVTEVVTNFHAAVDAMATGVSIEGARARLAAIAEGSKQTAGSNKKAWR